MLETTDLIHYLKAATIAQLGFLILNFLIRVKLSTRSILGSLFTSSLIAYFICPWLDHSTNTFILILVHTGCFSVSIFFYLFVTSLFEDGFKLKTWHAVLFLSLNIFCFYVFLASDIRSQNTIFAKVLFSMPQVFYLGLILLTLGKVLKDKNIDLLESRREFRVIFSWVTGIYSMSVVLMEVITKDSGYSLQLDLINSSFIFILVFFISFRIFQFRDNVFPTEEIQTEEVSDEPLDETLLQKLDSLLKVQKIFLQENLTISVLAKQLNVPEKKVRRLINKGLGYRNFNEFLNQFRIQEAKFILSDPSKNDFQVLRIAMDLGYGSLAPFNRAFKEIVGMTPSDFRKQKNQVK
ncbi:MULTISPECIES: AraC family transcriptional regulator [unclassified Leptospira]|uniref:helix-turn-helix domain-containing protein n=1 Tax=unclassified Leptospira TaxID=2633828 RepID=UPI0002BDEF54|nr:MULTISPECIES: helix-turn-helix domain-containing protein [unclassified Leptospira]EMJ99164.1 DNA-binding helix-turn-helix protein [Leptospira sp. B5-022]MCR1795003.1 helix-turn-helix domain-containing protein [Leptospira sp. id769339]